MLELGLESSEYVNLIRNNSAKSRKIIDFFQSCIQVGQNDALSVIKYLNLEKIFCLRKKYILMIVSHGKK
jgi:hypothetical protein